MYGLAVCTKVFGMPHSICSSGLYIVQQVYAGQRTSKASHICMHRYRSLYYSVFNFEWVYIHDILIKVLKHFQEVYELAVCTETLQMFPSMSQKLSQICTPGVRSTVDLQMLTA